MQQNDLGYGMTSQLMEHFLALKKGDPQMRFRAWTLRLDGIWSNWKWKFPTLPPPTLTVDWEGVLKASDPMELLNNVEFRPCYPIL